LLLDLFDVIVFIPEKEIFNVGNEKRILYCALKDRIINPDCNIHCHHNPDQCWYLLIASTQEELDYYRQIYGRKKLSNNT